jgi:hypothetical protein
MVIHLATEIQRSEISRFSFEVLERLPFFMEERKPWLFIACFCDKHDSDLHWRDYGDYRLTFPAPGAGRPSLKLLDPDSECWYQRVIYEEGLQRRAIKRALRSILLAVSDNTSGQNEGPWAQAMVDGCARNVAQLLLGLAVGFKRISYKGEREWRIVCAPRLGSNNSAPKWIDEKFAVNIKRSPRPHVLLQVRAEHRLFEPLLVPPVPFLDWAWNPNGGDHEAIRGINQILRSDDRADLVRVP